MGTEVQQRQARRLAVAIAFLGGAPACSLFIDFDAYRGSGPSGADASESGTVDSGPEAGEDDASCEASDLLGDPSNCGACGRVCNEGAGSCDAGRCPFTPLFDEDGGVVQALALAPHPDAGDYLYFTTAESFVARRSLTPGTPATIEKGPTGGAVARALAVNDDGTLGVAAVGVRTIDTFEPAPFANQPLAVVSTDHYGLGPVWLSGKTVFWGDNQGVWWSATTADASANGGPDAAAGVPVAFAELTGTVLWVTGGGTVYSTDAKTPAKITRLLTGSGAQTFASIAVSRSYLYLCQKTPLGGGLVVYATANLGQPLRTVAMIDPQAVIADGQFVYVVDFRSKAGNESRLLRLRADGTQLVILADGFRSSRGLALDDHWVYFGDGSRILRTSK